MAITNIKHKQGELDLVYSKTYAQLVALKDANKLIPKANYKIIDFKTKHRIPNTTEIYEHDTVEPLIIQAITIDSFNEEAKSELYPDDIIYYDFNNNLCEDGTTARNGWIYYRKDNLKNIEITGYDWRHCRFRRWRISAKAKETITTLSSNELTTTLTFSPLNGSWLTFTPRVYQVEIPESTVHLAGQLTLTVTKGSTTVTKPLLKSDNSDTFTENELSGTVGQIVYDPVRNVFVYMSFYHFGEDIVGYYASTTSTDFDIGYGLRYEVDDTDYQDYTTFPLYGANTHNIKIGRLETKGGLGNNVFLHNYLNYITIGNKCLNNTFTGLTYNITIGNECYNNLIHSDFHWVQAGNEFFGNYIQGIGYLGIRIQNMFIPSEFYYNSLFLGTFGAGNFGVNGMHQNQFYLKGNTFSFTNTVEASLVYLLGADGGSGRTSFVAQGHISASVLGYFDANNLTIVDHMYRDSIFERPAQEAKLPGTIVDELDITTLQTPTGATRNIGLDENNKVIELPFPATELSAAEIGDGLSLKSDKITLGDDDTVTFAPRTPTNDDGSLNLKGTFDGAYVNPLNSGNTTTYKFDANGIFLQHTHTNSKIELDSSLTALSSSMITSAQAVVGGTNTVAATNQTSNPDNTFNLLESDRGSGDRQQLLIGYFNGAWNSQFIDSSPTPKGIKYAGDYEPNFEPRTLITKQYVDNAIQYFVTSPNGLIKVGDYTTLDNSVTMRGDLDSWIWRLNSDYENTTSQSFNFAPTTAGNTRYDLIIGDNNGDYIVVPGTETLGTAVYPLVANNEVPLIEVRIGDTGVLSVTPFAPAAFVKYDTNVQNLTTGQRLNARTNIQAVSKDTDDSRTGVLTNNGIVYVNAGIGTTTLSGSLISLNTGEDGTASSYMLNLKNTSGGGIEVQKRGSTRIRSNGDSLTNYFILELYGSNGVIRSKWDNASFENWNTQYNYAPLHNRDTVYIRKAGPNNGSSAALVQRFEIDSNELHTLGIRNTQNVQAVAGEVQWLIEYTSDAGGGLAKTRDMIGFARNAVTIFGGRALPTGLYADLTTLEGNNVGTPTYRVPLRQYAYGMSQFEDGVIIGTDTNKLSSITTDNKLYVEGDATANGSLITRNIGDTALSTSKWRLGGATDSVNNSVTKLIDISINGVTYKLLARQ